MAIQGTQNLSGITFNKGAGVLITLDRKGNIDFGIGEDTIANPEVWQQGDTVNFGITNVYGGTAINVMDAPYSMIPDYISTSQATATYNTAILNALFASRQPLSIYIPGYGFAINDTIIIPSRTAFYVHGNGVGFPEPDSYYLNYNAGPMSRLVWHGSLDRPMVRYKGYGLQWDNVALQGAPATGTFAQMTGTAISSMALCGMLVESNQSGLGVGKINSRGFSPMLCQTGIQWGEEWNVDNSDESHFDRFEAHYCGVGWRQISRQALGFTIDYFAGLGTRTGMFIQGGGKMDIVQGVAIHPNSKFIVIGQPGVETNGGQITIQSLSVDNNFATGIVLQCNDTLSPLMFNVGLHLGNTQLEGYPIIQTSGNTYINIKDGFNLVSGMILGRSNAAFAPVVNIGPAKWAPGIHNNPTGVINSASIGTTTVFHQGGAGYTGNHIFPRGQYTWTNGVITQF